MDTKPLGDWGEGLAADHLARRGWRVLERKFRSGRREIDLVARRGEVVAFVEVKTRTGEATGHPFEAIHARKRRTIAHVAGEWIRRFGDEVSVYRFDAVAVTRLATGATRVHHLEDAWRLDSA